MAVTVPLNTGKARTSGAASLSVSFASLPSAGDAILVDVSALSSLTLNMASGNVTDNQSGSYALDVTREATASTYYTASGVWSDLNIASPSGTFTVTYSRGSGSPGMIMGAVAARALATSSALDVSTSGTASSTTPSTGTTGTTGQTDEVAVAVFAQLNLSGGAQTVTDPSGYTVIYNEGNSAAYCVSGGAYKILTATGTQTAGWSITGSAYTWTACIATYRGVARDPLSVSVSECIDAVGKF